MEGGKPVLQRYPSVTPANAVRIATLVTAARQYKAVIKGKNDHLIDLVTESLIAAALAID